jgi:hypothetical protein
MHRSTGLRVYVSARIIAGLIVGSLGTFVAQAVFVSGFGAIGGFIIWIVSVFFSLFIALQGVLVLIEAAVEEVT